MAAYVGGIVLFVCLLWEIFALSFQFLDDNTREARANRLTRARPMLTLFLCVMLLLLFALMARPASAQTHVYTNADLTTRPDRAPPAPASVYAALQTHAFTWAPAVPLVPPLFARRPSLPRSDISAVWPWPVERPRVRLDGTPITSPPAQYGAQPPFIVIQTPTQQRRR